MLSGATAGVVGGIFGLLLCAAAVMALFLWHRRRNIKERVRKERRREISHALPVLGSAPKEGSDFDENNPSTQCESTHLTQTRIKRRQVGKHLQTVPQNEEESQAVSPERGPRLSMSEKLSDESSRRNSDERRENLESSWRQARSDKRPSRRERPF